MSASDTALALKAASVSSSCLSLCRSCLACLCREKHYQHLPDPYNQCLRPLALLLQLLAGIMRSKTTSGFPDVPTWICCCKLPIPALSDSINARARMCMLRRQSEHGGRQARAQANLLLGSRPRACLKSLRAPSTSCFPRRAVPRRSSAFTLSSSFSALSQSASAASNCISCAYGTHESGATPLFLQEPREAAGQCLRTVRLSLHKVLVSRGHTAQDK